MKKHISMALAVLLLLVLAACGPATSLTTPPASSEPYYPLTTQTGVEPVDRVLRAAASGDPQNLRAVIEFFNAGCTQREGLGGPPKCRAGEAEGTPVEVLAFLGSEGGHIRKDEIDNWPGFAASGVYAVYEVNAAALSSEQYYPVGQYAILFVRGASQEAIALRIGESGIVRVDSIFDASPANLRALVEREASKVILAPKNGE